MPSFSEYFSQKYEQENRLRMGVLPSLQDEEPPLSENGGERKGVFLKAPGAEREPAQEPAKSEFRQYMPRVIRADAVMSGEMRSAPNVVSEEGSVRGAVIPQQESIPFHGQPPVAVPSQGLSMSDGSLTNPAVSRSITVLSEDTILSGDLSITGDACIFGKVKGNLSCTGTMEVEGKIIGNLTAEHLVMNACEVKGDVSATGSASVGKGAVIIGNLSAQEVSMDARIKGDVTATKKTHLMGKALVVGNVKTASVVIDEGAVLQGQVKIVTAAAEQVSNEKAAGAARKKSSEKEAKPAFAEPKHENKAAEKSVHPTEKDSGVSEKSMEQPLPEQSSDSKS